MQVFLLVWTSINLLLSIVLLTMGQKGKLTEELKNDCDDIILESTVVEIVTCSLLMMTIAIPCFVIGAIAGTIENTKTKREDWLDLLDD